jgi:hypothetical protein
MVSPSFFLKAPAKVPRTVWSCQPVNAQICAIVAPSGPLEHRDHGGLLAVLAGSRLALDGYRLLIWLGVLWHPLGLDGGGRGLDLGVRRVMGAGSSRSRPTAA